MNESFPLFGHLTFFPIYYSTKIPQEKTSTMALKLGTIVRHDSLTGLGLEMGCRGVVCG